MPLALTMPSVLATPLVLTMPVLAMRECGCALLPLAELLGGCAGHP